MVQSLPLQWQPRSLPSPLPNPLPTMYDLPSEDPEEPGLPDLFHDKQPELLKLAFVSPCYPADQRLIATDLNLYYDLAHTRWYKRPDWFLVLGVNPGETIADLRLSYVIWQEQIVPFLVIELLSPGTEEEDLGQTPAGEAQPPAKWEVYEQILQIPYYGIYDRYSQRFRLFRLDGGRYQELLLPDQRWWFPEIQVGLGVWEGSYDGTEGRWLRWYDAAGAWIPTPMERAEQERERAEQERERAEQERERAEQERERAEAAIHQQQRERERAEQLADYLRSLGIDPDRIAPLTSFPDLNHEP